MASNTLSGSAWMIGLSLVLGWIPIVGPLVAGFVGGRRAGSPRAAAVAAILPALIVGALVAIVVWALPQIGFGVAALFGAAVVLWIGLQMGLVLLGAIAGGAMAHRGTSGGRPAI